MNRREEHGQEKQEEGEGGKKRKIVERKCEEEGMVSKRGRVNLEMRRISHLTVGGGGGWVVW